MARPNTRWKHCAHCGKAVPAVGKQLYCDWRCKKAAFRKRQQ